MLQLLVGGERRGINQNLRSWEGGPREVLGRERNREFKARKF